MPSAYWRCSIRAGDLMKGCVDVVGHDDLNILECQQLTFYFQLRFS